ncbi:MAG TPA: hypothetical protein VNN06_06810 [Ramlibacter sp.]|nr:hypothetical protein [Ramlibacter sp.]
MGLLKKLFGGGDAAGPETQPHSSQFHESETTAQHHGTRNAPRRELVQVVLRDTMRKHGIPSDWIDCRILSVVTRRHQSGMHVQFIVGKGQNRLLNYVQAFQDSFWEEIEKFEPHARDWLFSLAWQFDGAGEPRRSMPVPAEWNASDIQRDADSQRGADSQWDGDTLPSDLHEDDLASDLQALYAIRDAAIAQPSPAASSPGAAGPAGPKGPARS